MLVNLVAYCAITTRMRSVKILILFCAYYFQNKCGNKLIVAALIILEKLRVAYWMFIWRSLKICCSLIFLEAINFFIA